MSETPQQSNDDGPDEPLGGARLAVARLKNDISTRDIAKELHLDEPTVLALEQNNFDMLGAPVFAKGHLRKYAELVGVPVEDVLADYYQMNRAVGAPPVVKRAQTPARSVSPGPWIAAVFVVSVATAAGWWWYTRAPSTPSARPEVATLAPFTSDAVEEPAPEAANTVSEQVEEPARDTLVDAGDSGNSAQTSSATEESPAIVESSLEPVVDDRQPLSGDPILLPQVRIELSFSGDCWTEVTDASGRQLFYDLGNAGQVLALSGDGPLRLVLGDSSVVSMTADGQDYPVPAPSRSGSLTRLTVNSQ